MRWDQIWFFGLGILLSSMVVCTNVAKSAETDNLLTNNFTLWDGTNDHYHGPNILAGVHGEYKEQTVILSDHLTIPEIQGGFTSSFESEVWHWHSFENTTSITQSIESATGEVVNQTVTMSHTCSNWNGCGYIDSPDNIIVIPTNDQLDYEITARFDFDVPSRPNGHYGADIRNPSLVVSYDEFQLDITDLNEIFETIEFEEDLDLSFEDMWLDEFTELYIEDDDVIVFAPLEVPDMPFLEYDLSFDEYMWEDEITIDNDTDLELLDEDPIFFLGDAPEVEADSEDEFFESAADMSLFFTEYEEELPEEESDTQIGASNLEPSLENEENDENSVEIQDDLEFVESTKPSEALGEAKEGVEVVEVTSEINPTVEIREVVVVSIDDYLTDNLNKIDEMVAAQGIMQEQNIYIEQAIYPNQVFYVDNRVLAQNISLNINDPLEEYQLKILNNQKKQNELKRKLNELKWN